MLTSFYSGIAEKKTQKVFQMTSGASWPEFTLVLVNINNILILTSILTFNDDLPLFTQIQNCNSTGIGHWVCRYARCVLLQAIRNSACEPLIEGLYVATSDFHNVIVYEVFYGFLAH